MKQLLTNAALLALIGIVAALPPTAGAVHDDFRFKWPYLPDQTPVFLQFPLSGSTHGVCPDPILCSDAWDMVIADDDVRSSAEGIVAQKQSLIQANTCDPDDGFGNFVKVQVPTPTGDILLTYAHLASTAGPPVGDRILQGDDIGVQGHTGFTVDSEPGGCFTHLHFQFGPNPPPGDPPAQVHPNEIDGIPATQANAPYPSTNSPVGAFSLPGEAIKQKYLDLGDPWSWASVGWTHAANQGLDAHDYKVWALEQNFRQHADPWGREVRALFSPAWDQSSASFMTSPFWAPWAWAEGKSNIGGVPRADQTTSCPPDPYLHTSYNPAICAVFQPLHYGHMWMDSVFLGVHFDVCPDIARDHVVDVLDIQWVAFRFGAQVGDLLYDPYYDVDLGDGAITIADIYVVSGGHGKYCAW